MEETNYQFFSGVMQETKMDMIYALMDIPDGSHDRGGTADGSGKDTEDLSGKKGG